MPGTVLGELGDSLGTRRGLGFPGRGYNSQMERKIFWAVFVVLGLIADFVLPIWWALFSTIPIVFVSWWVAYRSGWFE
jgi:Flp pilus assembly protein TadB